MQFWEQLDKPGLLMAAGVALLAAVLLRRAYRRLARSKSADRQPKRVELSGSVRRAQSSSLDSAEVQLHEMARELSAQLDSKAVLLEHWIRLARDEADRLERAIATAQELGLTKSETTTAAGQIHERTP